MKRNRPVILPVESVQIMLFARALGDDSPVFSDLSHPETMMAPPTFTESLKHFIPDFEFRPRRGEPWRGSGAEPSGMALPEDETTLHAEQYFDYHCPVRPGDILTAITRDGKSWEKAGSRGTMHFFEWITEFRNQHGELAVTSTLVGVTIISSSEESKVDA